MEKFRVYGVATKEETQREKEHKALARKAAAEGMVLLKNDGILPLQPGKIALYGTGARMTVKGGRGSGDVQERHSVSIEEGLLGAGFSFPTATWMDRFEEKHKLDVDAWRTALDERTKRYSPFKVMDMFIMIGEHPMPLPTCAPVLREDLTTDTDTAVYVLSRQAGEGDDRRVEKGDYLLSDMERDSLRLLSAHYQKLILILNCGGALDLSVLDDADIRIDALLYCGQPGMAGGNAVADVLTGRVTPSGRLTATWARQYADYPCAETFGHRNEDLAQENYEEGIYVGYRWFTATGSKPRFPFGFGLSYTDFSQELLEITADNGAITCRVQVQNTGKKYAGRQVVQLYLAKPSGVYDVEPISLAAFAKTKTLAPQESETLTLSFDLRQQAVFSEAKSAFLLPAGKYGLLLGESSASCTACAVLTLSDEVELETAQAVNAHALCFADYKAAPAATPYDTALPRVALTATDFAQASKAPIAEQCSTKVQALLAKLTPQEKIALVTGGGYAIRCFNNVMGAAGRTATDLLKKGIPNIVLADGPAGLNVNQSTLVMRDGSPRYPDGLPQDWQWGWLKHMGWLMKGNPKKGRQVYRYMTAWPNATLQAQTWDCDLVQEIGVAIGKEMLEIGVSVWLAPGFNIQRNPLCGRNFEYYAEDPLVSGKMAAAITRGVQSAGGVGVSVKHFCCNNQEDNRMEVSANVSQRALREIYLRAYRIAVTEGDPWTVMSSYNRVNGLHTVNSPDLLNRVLREEWGYGGLVMSDWNAAEQCSYAAAINAGNDLIMPGTKDVRKALEQARKDGTLNPDALDRSAARVLTMIFNSATAEGF